jgi:hypothetical protein
LTHYEKSGSIGIVLKRYRKKTETEKALHAIKLWDMSPVKLQYTFGGDASEWGRILKGQHQVHGEYLAVCKEINIRRHDATITWQAAKKKYGKRTRNGGIVPRTRNVLRDIYNYHEEQVFEKRISNIFSDSDDGYDYGNLAYSFYSEGPHLPESHEEDQNTRRDFLNSLKVKL